MFEIPEITPSGLAPVCVKCQGRGKDHDGTGYKVCEACRGTGLMQKPPMTQPLGEVL